MLGTLRHEMVERKEADDRRIVLLFHFIMYSHFYMESMYDDIRLQGSTVVHFLPRQSLIFDIPPHSVQTSSVRRSYLPSPLYFNFGLENTMANNH